MKNKILITKIVIVSLSFIIGFGLSIQLNNSEFGNNGRSISETAAHLQSELTGVRERRESVEKSIQEVESRIKSLQGAQSEEGDIHENLMNEIQQYELRAGLTKAHGPGVVVDFLPADDKQFKNLIINYDLLISVINKLNAAGAEGITLNEERIIALSDFRYEQGNLYVNGNPIVGSVQIRAVGDPDTLEATLNMKYGILWEIRNNFNIKSKIEKAERVQLPKYTSNITFDYIEIQG